jgi:hypothetical protein
MKKWRWTAAFLFCLVSYSNSQIKRTTVPLGDTLNKALSKYSLISQGSEPFHLRVVVSEPENPQSHYQGIIEEWWISPSQWRREVTDKDGLKQTIVFLNGTKTEQDEGDYFPLWLRTFVTAAFEPVPNLSAWTSSGLQIEQITMPNGDKSDACVRTQAKIGEGDRASTSYSNLCFDKEGRLQFFGSPRYSMEFRDYRSFGKKQFPKRFVDHPEPGTELVGAISVLEDKSKFQDTGSLFVPLKGDDDRFASIPISTAQLELLSVGNPDIVWQPVHSGNVHGRLAMYVSVDLNGQVREAWPLNSDNAGLEDSARDQVRQWKLKPAADKNGNHVQVDGGLSFVFDTKIGDPIPELTDAEVRSLAVNLVEPRWAAGSLKSGEIVEVQVSVNEQGELTGTGFAKVPSDAQGPVMNATRQWSFRPLMRNGKPQYFHGVIRFIAP